MQIHLYGILGKTDPWRIQDFPDWGGGVRRHPTIWPIFPENCMKKKKFGPRGACPLRPPLP